eukprot:m.74237 g.74237  ORF g.74237 m.74237 type:complete len:136 (-) comp11794_c0_seq8:380-787(-)
MEFSSLSSLFLSEVFRVHVHVSVCILLINVLLLILFSHKVTGSVTVALTYFQLSGEDHKWWWRSVFSAGATGAFVFAYSIFYFTHRSNMHGMLQTVQFFGYTLLGCYVVFMMLGAVGYISSLAFIRYIYKNIKVD